MRLRDLIVEGAYPPGQRLAHGRLMQSLGVGRTPLRTALSRLEGDGLVGLVVVHLPKPNPAAAQTRGTPSWVRGAKTSRDRSPSVG